MYQQVLDPVADSLAWSSLVAAIPLLLLFILLGVLRVTAWVASLISLAVAVTTRCDGCISIHSNEAAKAGATREEVAEALGVAIAMNAGAALVYSTRTLEAFDAAPGA